MSPLSDVFFLGAMGGGLGWALKVRPEPPLDPDPDPDPLADPQGPGWTHPGPLGPSWGYNWDPTGGHVCFWENKNQRPH